MQILKIDANRQSDKWHFFTVAIIHLQTKYLNKAFYGFQIGAKIKCFTVRQHNYFFLVYTTDQGSVIKQAIEHLFSDTCYFLVSQLALFFKFYFYAVFKIFGFPFTYLQTNQKIRNKTNISIFILPDMSFKVMFKYCRRSF